MTSAKVFGFVFLFILIICSVFSEAHGHGLGFTYTDKEIMVQQWKDLCDDHPNDASYEIIGQSFENKDIYLFKIGNPLGAAVMMDGQAHGDEDAGSEIMLVFARWLLESDDPRAQNISRNNYNLFIPVLNPDSYVRQNMRRHYVLENGTIVQVPHGVDLNRNAIWRWGERSGSANPWDDYDYRGLYAGSEPETQAWRTACDKYSPQVYLNLHNGAYGSILYHSNMTLDQQILKLMSNFAEKLGVPKYSAKLGLRGGGFIASDADETFGASGWLIEVLSWSEMPDSKEELLDEYYPKMLPIFLAANFAVYKQASTVFSICDVRGDNKTKFESKDDVYIKGQNLEAELDFKLYIISNNQSVSVDNALVSCFLRTDGDGDLPLSKIWDNPVIEGNFDVWVDINQNNVYDPSEDFLLNPTLDVTAFEVVIPEFSLCAILSMSLIAMVIVILYRRNLSNNLSVN